MDFGKLTNRFAVRGTHFRAENITHVQAGADVCLEPEPENEYDPRAVRVMAAQANGVDLLHIGYVPRELCAQVHRLLERDGAGIWNTKVQSVTYDDGQPVVYVSFESSELLARQGSVDG